MNLVESFLTKNPCFKAGKTIVVKGLMLHSVGCPQPNASVFINSWNKSSFNRAACMLLLTKTTKLYIKLFCGIEGAGTADPV